MEQLPFADASFDVVACAGALSYGEVVTVADEILRVLKPGGRFICVDSLNTNPLYRLNRWMHYARGERSRSTLLRMPSLRSLDVYRQRFPSVDVAYFGAMTFLVPTLAAAFGELSSSAHRGCRGPAAKSQASGVQIHDGCNEGIEMGIKATQDFDLGRLSDPACLHGRIALRDSSREELVHYLRMMLLIRLAEQKLAEMRRGGFIGGPVHLGAGQEAVAVGVSASLGHSDRVFGAHRSHSHLLAMGSSVRGLFAEVLGRDTGLSRGMGGSMHLWDQPRGFYGSVPIVAGTVPLAVGAGLAARMQGTRDVAVAYFGDGAMEEGVVHESLNLARVLNVPVLFVVENNLFASHMHISLRQPMESTARFAVANGMDHSVVDGNDVVAVAAAAKTLITHAREGRGPAFLEAVTYRWYGHVDWREDIDVGVDRSAETLANWRKRDPVRRLVESMEEAGMWSPGDSEALREDLVRQVDGAWDQASSDPYPADSALLERVYAP